MAGIDDNAIYCPTTYVDDVEAVDRHADSSGSSPKGEVLQELDSTGEAFTRVELDIAFSSEKLVNLSLLMIHVATKESDFETFASEQENDSLECTLEFDLLSGILESEAREFDNFLADIQSEIVNAHVIISSCENLGEAFVEMEEKLLDFEESLKQSQSQVSEMRQQSAEFRKTLLSYCGEASGNCDKGVDVLQNGQFSNVYAKIKIQTAEQQRRILRMLEKSLARELDLEKRLTESRLVEDGLKLRLKSSEEEVICAEEELAVIWGSLLQADNAAEVMMGASKELITQLQICQFNLNGFAQREVELKSQLQGCKEQINTKEIAMQKLQSCSAEIHDRILRQTNCLKAILINGEDELVVPDSEASTLEEEGSLEKQHMASSLDDSTRQHYMLCSDLSELDKAIEDLKERYFETVSKVEIAESKCKLLTEANEKLDKELCLHRENGITSDKVILLERRLRDSDIQLQHMVASSEASQEKQNMLYSTVADMENVIEDLKLKVSKAELWAEGAEEKCMRLSKSNADLNEDVRFLRTRVESLETCLHQAEKTKMESARGINLRTKVITELVMQLAIERERLYNKISSLMEANSVLVEKLQQANKDPSKKLLL